MGRSGLQMVCSFVVPVAENEDCERVAWAARVAKVHTRIYRQVFRSMGGSACGDSVPRVSLRSAAESRLGGSASKAPSASAAALQRSHLAAVLVRFAHCVRV